MAYTIISQNNSTTTLSDGVNTITVPSRVNLTSGNFIIVEVNNNMATLEDGDGNVYRDIPCVATLAGEGGGGGGSSLPDQTGHSGEFLTTDGTDASWAAVDALPSQTGNSGKFLTTDGTDASWSDKPLVNKATATRGLSILSTTGNATDGVFIGSNTYGGMRGTATGSKAQANQNGTAYGYSAYATVSGTAIGCNMWANANNAIQIGSAMASVTNSDANTFKVANANGNYEMMDANGFVPTARLTKVNSTITIAVADWNGGTTVTKTVSGITATGVVFVNPDPTDQAAYTSNGLLCTNQTTDSLTFTCSTTPSADIDVNVVML